jgi:hypothetical protein
MSESTALVVVDPAFDKTVPTEYVGKLEPAWHCRAWNSGRRHYCKQRAGSGTDHVGSGRCKWHGGRIDGSHLLVHGQSRRRYTLKNHRPIGEQIAAYQRDPDPFSIAEELGVLRAVLHEFLDHQDFDISQVGQVAHLVDTVSKVIWRVEQAKALGMISFARLAAFMAAIDQALLKTIVDPQLRREVRSVVFGIRV